MLSTRRRLTRPHIETRLYRSQSTANAAFAVGAVASDCTRVAARRMEALKTNKTSEAPMLMSISAAVPGHMPKHPGWGLVYCNRNVGPSACL